jgi:hypothetical protein
MTSQTVTKQELLTRIREGYNTFNALLRSIRPGDQLMKLGDWTAAEHVAHVASWEKLAQAVLTGANHYEAMGLTAEDWQQDTDGINEALHRQHAGIGFEDARSMLSQTHAALVAAIEASSDDDLARPLGSSAEDTVADLIEGNTFAHYEEHAGWMREALGR